MHQWPVSEICRVVNENGRLSCIGYQSGTDHLHNLQFVAKRS
ncbi:hypothetical protein NSPZN2_100056 [Nitrospira defluvii]|uniref:Transposase n=1 Tax=Nitrospira defluvii TaxID=330214 RepID=A0ABM8QZL8_9BACT|nr:hypothetical protein NSPZN2_100056 [Nitrospira defluvii]